MNQCGTTRDRTPYTFGESDSDQSLPVPNQGRFPTIAVLAEFLASSALKWRVTVARQPMNYTWFPY